MKGSRKKLLCGQAIPKLPLQGSLYLLVLVLTIAQDLSSGKEDPGLSQTGSISETRPPQLICLARQSHCSASVAGMLCESRGKVSSRTSEPGSVLCIYISS